MKRVDSDPRDLSIQLELAKHLQSKNRKEDCIPVLLNIIAVDRNYDNSNAYQMLMDIFAELGTANEAVKSGRRKLASIMF